MLELIKRVATPKAKWSDNFCETATSMANSFGLKSPVFTPVALVSSIFPKLK